MTSGLEIGRHVQAGELLVALDAQSQRLDLQRAQATLAGLTPQRQALLTQISAQGTALRRERDASAAQAAETEAALPGDEAQAELLASEEGRINALRARGLASPSDSQHAATEAQRARAAVNVQRFALARIRHEALTRQADRRAAIDQLHSALRELETRISSAQADLARLSFEVSRRELVSPLDGTIADAAPLSPGSVVAPGQRLAMIVPDGPFRVVARFPPTSAGRIHAGQRALVRLDAFPWAQYGVVHARVADVASEPSDTSIRVEFAIVGPTPSGVPLQHGLQGAVDVEVDYVSPARLLLRDLGAFAARPADRNPSTP